MDSSSAMLVLQWSRKSTRVRILIADQWRVDPFEGNQTLEISVPPIFAEFPVSLNDWIFRIFYPRIVIFALLECGRQEDETATLWRKTRSKLGRSSVLIAVRRSHKFEINTIQNSNWEFLFLNPFENLSFARLQRTKKIFDRRIITKSIAWQANATRWILSKANSTVGVRSWHGMRLYRK